MNSSVHKNFSREEVFDALSLCQPCDEWLQPGCVQKKCPFGPASLNCNYNLNAAVLKMLDEDNLLLTQIKQQIKEIEKEINNL